MDMDEIMRILDTYEETLKERQRAYDKDPERNHENSLTVLGRLSAVQVLRHRFKKACSETKSQG